MPITIYKKHSIISILLLCRIMTIIFTVITYASTILVAVLLKCIDPTTPERYSRTCHFGVPSMPLSFRQLRYNSMVKSQDYVIVNACSPRIVNVTIDSLLLFPALYYHFLLCPLPLSSRNHGTTISIYTCCNVNLLQCRRPVRDTGIKQCCCILG